MDNEIWDTISIYGYKINIKSEVDKNYDEDGLNDYEKSYHDFLVTMQDYQDKFFNHNSTDDEIGANRFSLELLMTTVDKDYEMGNGDITVENQCIVVIGIKNPTGNLKELAEKHNSLLEIFANKKEMFSEYNIETSPKFYSGIPWVVSLDINSQDSFSDSDEEDSSYNSSDYDESSSDEEETESSISYTATSDD
jgi:hypothetical protein